MVDRPLAQILKAAVVAGLVAGALAGGFHFFWTEPLIDRAIAVEESSKAAAARSSSEPVVSRPGQRAGLVLGFLLYGLGCAVLLGGVVFFARSHFPAWSEAKRGVVFGAALGWSLAILPTLKYPANPPGVGDPGTIGYRQELFLTALGLALLGAALVIIVYPYLRRAQRWAWPVSLSIYAVFLTAVFIALPAILEPSPLPADLIREFRVLSLLGHVIFWGSLAGLFAWLLSANRSR
jgi:predicted cobalt transporter CbtA